LLKDSNLQRSQQWTTYNNLKNLPPSQIDYLITDQVIKTDLKQCQHIIDDLYREAVK
jgi:hypothetical protein